MNFALGINIASATELSEILERAMHLSFSGIELNFSRTPIESEVASMKQILTNSGIHLIAVSAGKDFTLAVELGSPVAVVEFNQFNGEKDLTTAADVAAASHMMLALENYPPLSDPRLLWALLEKLGRPAIGVCWNSRTSSSTGTPLSPSPGTPGEGRGGGYERRAMLAPHPNPPPEYQGREKISDSSAIVIPMLNSKICHVRIPPDKSEPSVPMLRRLQGIGYRDWITLDARGNNLADMTISNCLEQLRKATDPVLHKPKHHKAAGTAIKK